MKSTLQQIYQKQRDWATQRNINFDAAGYTNTLDDNLFAPLSAESRRNFDKGSGNELGKENKRGKMQALHSSSALVCNVFDYWRDRDKAPLARALGAPDNATEMQFEQRFPTGLGGNPPNLDVTLSGTGTKLFAIEAKFTEPYQGHQSKVPFRDSYFPAERGLWAKYNLPQCETLARSIYEKRAIFVRLGAAQLLKHILGLYKKQGNNFTLLYLWYDYPSTESQQHRSELEAFKQQVDSSLDFRTITYNDLFDRLRKGSGIDSRYISYLEARYFTA